MEISIFCMLVFLHQLLKSFLCFISKCLKLIAGIEQESSGSLWGLQQLRWLSFPFSCCYIVWRVSHGESVAGVAGSHINGNHNFTGPWNVIISYSEQISSQNELQHTVIDENQCISSHLSQRLPYLSWASSFTCVIHHKLAWLLKLWPSFTKYRKTLKTF